MTMRGLARRLSSNRGSSLVELAVALPVLIVIIAGTIDFARVFYLSVSLTDAARAGAQYGSYSVARSGNVAGMETAATNAIPDVTGVSADAHRSCVCATDDGAFSDTSPSPNNCTDPAAVSCPGQHVVVTVTVTASKTFTTVMHVLPGVPTSIDLSRGATLRVAN
jgi:Flp pilus assembly protein TadG